MKAHPSAIERFFINLDDWHTHAVNALEEAYQNTTSLQLRQTCEQALALLRENDECFHSVTVTKSVPECMADNYLMSKLRDIYDDDELSQPWPGVVSITVSGRGPLSNVQTRAESTLRNAIRKAVYGLHPLIPNHQI